MSFRIGTEPKPVIGRALRSSFCNSFTSKHLRCFVAVAWVWPGACSKSCIGVFDNELSVAESRRDNEARWSCGYESGHESNHESNDERSCTFEQSSPIVKRSKEMNPGLKLAGQGRCVPVKRFHAAFVDVLADPSPVARFPRERMQVGPISVDTTDREVFSQKGIWVQWR